MRCLSAPYALVSFFYFIDIVLGRSVRISNGDAHFRFIIEYSCAMEMLMSSTELKFFF